MNALGRRQLLQAAIAIVLCGTWSCGALADDSELATARVALRGYDPVSYFTDGHPVKGSSSFTFSFDDAVYHFASAEHQKLFAAHPDRYAPQYSGYCAVAVSMGFKVEPDPEAWVISEGRLYVFANKRALSLFAEDSADVVATANVNWADLRKER